MMSSLPCNPQRALERAGSTTPIAALITTGAVLLLCMTPVSVAAEDDDTLLRFERIGSSPTPPVAASEPPSLSVSLSAHTAAAMAGGSRSPAVDKHLDDSAKGFAQWLNAQPADEGGQRGPSEHELRELFNRAVQVAIERSPQVQLAQAEFEAAQADVDEAKGARWPQVEVGTRSRSVNLGGGDGAGDTSTNAITVSATTTLYDWGRTTQTIDAREQLAIAAAKRSEAEMENLAFEVSSTIIELGKQRIITDISQQFVDRMTTLVKMLGEIVLADPGRSSELTQARARLLQAQAAYDSAHSQAEDAEINLRKFVGDLAVAVPRVKSWNLRPVNLDLLLARVADHPTIQQSQAQAFSADAQARAIKASSLPQLNLVVGKSTGRDALGRQEPVQANLSMTWSAFRGGSERASQRAALQRAEASRQNTEQQRLDLEYRVRKAHHDARSFLERAVLFGDLTGETKRVRKAFFEQWYHLGRRTLLDVLIAENDHYSNRVSEVTNRFDGYQAIFREHASAGALAGWLSAR
jgi:adhesin transport system outer membrane protein